jgi:hypothetical protein
MDTLEVHVAFSRLLCVHVLAADLGRIGIK